MPNKKLTAEIGILIDDNFMDLYWAKGDLDFSFADFLRRLINRSDLNTLRTFTACCGSKFKGTVVVNYSQDNHDKWSYELSDPK